MPFAVFSAKYVFCMGGTLGVKIVASVFSFEVPRLQFIKKSTVLKSKVGRLYFPSRPNTHLNPALDDANARPFLEQWMRL